MSFFGLSSERCLASNGFGKMMIALDPFFLSDTSMQAAKMEKLAAGEGKSYTIVSRLNMERKCKQVTERKAALRRERLYRNAHSSQRETDRRPVRLMMFFWESSFFSHQSYSISVLNLLRHLRGWMFRSLRTALSYSSSSILQTHGHPKKLLSSLSPNVPASSM